MLSWYEIPEGNVFKNLLKNYTTISLYVFMYIVEGYRVRNSARQETTLQVVGRGRLKKLPKLHRLLAQPITSQY